MQGSSTYQLGALRTPHANALRHLINQLRSKAFDSSKVHSREKIRRGIRVGAFVWGYGDSRGTGPASRANDARGRYYES